ncbi:hypothetical protein [Imhoffiella purpurea]|uniref:Uncharacterized protein n=1 Tax=Imhoffiella purpurea TaxID=1249627 RepID=W9VDL1_9GAMM|nr:hypothetical protein [Imhoffiella purpurea]EXJ15076.1 hypothetical protein D779_1630 [Imhoffiella purpurea]
MNPGPERESVTHREGSGSWTLGLWIGSGLLAVVLIAGLAQRFWPLLHPDAIALAQPEPGCDLHLGACRASFADGATLTLGIRPRPISVMVPLQLDVGIEGLEPSEVEIDFVGVDMNMGFNRVRLVALGDGRYRGQGMLPVCVRAHMIWEARVLLHTARGIMAAPFRFETDRARNSAAG